MVSEGRHDPRSVIDSTFQRLLGDILNERFKPGERLPGDRELAREYGIGRSSMIRVLARLQEERYVERIPVRGTFVREDVHRRCPCVSLAFVNGDAELDPESIGLSGWSEIMEIMRGMFEEAALRPGCQVTLLHCEDTDEPARLRAQLEDLRRFDGVIFCGCRMQELKRRFAAECKPAVVVSPKPGVVPEVYPYIGIDPLDGIAAMAEYIVRCARGRRIVLLHWQLDPVDVPLSEKMLSVIELVFTRLKAVHERIFIDKSVSCNAEAHAVLDARFGSWDELRGKVVWCLNRRMLPVLNYLLNKNQIPAELFGGTVGAAAGTVYPPVTHLREPHCQMGHEAVAMLYGTLCEHRKMENVVLEPVMYYGAERLKSVD